MNLYAALYSFGITPSNIASLIDVMMVQWQLSNHSAEFFRSVYGEMLAEELDKDIPNFLYGVYKGYAFTLYNLVPTITSVIGVSSIENHSVHSRSLYVSLELFQWALGSGKGRTYYSYCFT